MQTPNTQPNGNPNTQHKGTPHQYATPSASAWEEAHGLEPGDLIGLDFSDALRWGDE